VHTLSYITIFETISKNYWTEGFLQESSSTKNLTSSIFFNDNCFYLCNLHNTPTKAINWNIQGTKVINWTKKTDWIISVRWTMENIFGMINHRTESKKMKMIDYKNSNSPIFIFPMNQLTIDCLERNLINIKKINLYWLLYIIPERVYHIQYRARYF